MEEVATLSIRKLKAIFAKHQYGAKKVLTFRGFRTVKMFNKRAVVRDMWKAISNEFRDQRTYLEGEVGKLRTQLVDDKKKMEANFMALVPSYAAEVKLLCEHLDGVMGDCMRRLPESQLATVKRLRESLNTAFEEHMSRISLLEKDAQEYMDKLKRRLLRMAKDLEMSESEIAQLREALSTSDEGVASIYLSVQGLSQSDKHYEKKKMLLKKLLDYNIQIRHSAENEK